MASSVTLLRHLPFSHGSPRQRTELEPAPTWERTGGPHRPPTGKASAEGTPGCAAGRDAQPLACPFPSTSRSIVWKRCAKSYTVCTLCYIVSGRAAVRCYVALR